MKSMNTKLELLRNQKKLTELIWIINKQGLIEKRKTMDKKRENKNKVEVPWLEIIERELGPNNAQRCCAENAEWIFRIVNVNKYNALNVNEDMS